MVKQGRQLSVDIYSGVLDTVYWNQLVYASYGTLILDTPQYIITHFIITSKQRNNYYLIHVMLTSSTTGSLVSLQWYL